MSQSMHVIGIIPPEEQYNKMKAVWDACKTAKVPIPSEVCAFFDGQIPDESGTRINMNNFDAVKNYSGDMDTGFEVDITKLPPMVKIIRFYVSY